MNVYEFNFTAIGGSSMPLRNWQGQPLLIVNTASKCNYARQFEGLQKVWKEYQHGGLVVIGVPCNDFGEQEPADEDVIAEFCQSVYGVSFPLTTKQHVIGKEAHPLYISILESMGSDALPRWNFHKYLFDRNGEMAGSWAAAVEPSDPAITHNIERYLQSWIL